MMGFIRCFEEERSNSSSLLTRKCGAIWHGKQSNNYSETKIQCLGII